MSVFSATIRKMALVAGAGLGLIVASSAALACDCYGDNDRYYRDYDDAYGNYSCYGGGYDCGYERDYYRRDYHRHYYGDDGYYRHRYYDRYRYRCDRDCW
jgi:hypothetical protein